MRCEKPLRIVARSGNPQLPFTSGGDEIKYIKCLHQVPGDFLLYQLHFYAFLYSSMFLPGTVSLLFVSFPPSVLFTCLLCIE